MRRAVRLRPRDMAVLMDLVAARVAIGEPVVAERLSHLAPAHERLAVAALRLGWAGRSLQRLERSGLVRGYSGRWEPTEEGHAVARRWHVRFALLRVTPLP